MSTEPTDYDSAVKIVFSMLEHHTNQLRIVKSYENPQRYQFEEANAEFWKARRRELCFGKDIPASRINEIVQIGKQKMAEFGVAA